MGAQGTATLNFGAFPGTGHATVNVTGQTGIVSGSLVEAWIRPVATADHTSDEHLVASFDVYAADIVAGTGFTIHGINNNQLLERSNVVRTSPYTAGGKERTGFVSKGIENLTYGQWTIAWAWN
jgi:hypothetical protein